MDLFTDDNEISLGEFKEAMAGNPNYNLDKDVVDRLVFRYSLGPDKNGKPKWAYFADDEDILWEKERMRACLPIARSLPGEDQGEGWRPARQRCKL